MTLGSGGVSVFALQFAALQGAKVISTSSSETKLTKMKELGASGLINYKTTPEWQEVVRNQTDGLGVDCVVEVGGPGTYTKSMQSLAYGGKIALIGVLTGVAGDANPLSIMMKGGNLHGIYVGSRASFEQMNKAIKCNDIHPVIDKVFPMEKVVEAYKYMQSQQHFGKVVIEIAA